MNRKHVSSLEVRNINDIDLDNPLHLRICVSQWDAIETLSEQHLKVKDLFIELEDRWNNSSLTKQHKDAMNLYLIEGYTQKDAGDLLGIGTRAVAKFVDEGIELMANFNRGQDGIG